MKTRKSFKRVLSMLLALTLILSNVMVSGVLAAETELAPPADVSRVVFVNGAAAGTGDGLSPENAFTSLEAAFEYLDDGTGDAVIVICGTVEVAKSYNNLTVANGKVTWDGVYYITGDYGTDYSDSALIQFTNSSTANINMGGKTHFSNLKMQLDDGGVTFYTAGGMTIGEGVECEIKSNKISIYGGCWEGDYEGDVAIKVSSGKIGTIMGGTKDYTVKGAVNITVGGSAEITGNITSAYKKTTGNVNLTVNGGEINTIYAVGRQDGTIGGDLTINLNAGEITQIIDHSGTGQKAKSVTVNLKPACQIGTFTALASGRVTATNGTTLNLLGYNGTLPAGILDCFGSVNVKDSSKATYTSALGASTAVVVESGSTLRLGGNENGTGLNVSGDVKYGMPVASVLYVNGEKVYGSGETPDGSKTAPYTSLADAYAYIDDEAGGTVVIMGDTKWDGDYSGYGITGTVNITSSYDGDSYITGDDPAYLVLTGDVTLSDSTNIDNVKVNVKASKMFLYTGMELTIGSNVTMSDGVKDAKLKVVCGKDGSTATKGQKISVSIASGKYHTIFMGNTNPVDTGSVDLTLSGTANVWSNVQVSPNKGSAEALHFTMEGNSDVKCIFNSGGTDGVVAGNITIDLKSGTIKEMRQAGTNERTTGDITVNLYGGFQYGSGSFGTWDGVKTGTRTLNLIGFNGTLSTGAAANYKVLCVKNASHVTYAGTLASGSTVTAETGSTLILSGYESQAAAEAAGVVFAGISGNLLFAGEKIEYLDVVYLDGTLTESGDGKTAGTAVATFGDAFKLLDPEKGGTIVLCGEFRITSQVDLSAYNVAGQVTLTSVYGGVDYRSENGAKLTYVGDAQKFGASGNMVMDNMVVNMESTASGTSQFIYTGAYLHVTDTVTTTGTGRWKIFVSYIEPDPSHNCFGLIEGGTYYQIFMGSNKGNTGDATMTFDKNASVISNVCMGGNSSNTVNNVTFNMKGGYVKVIFDMPAGGTVKGDLVMNLTGGSIVEMRDYTGKTDIAINGDIIINVGSGFGTGSAQFGVWSASSVTVGGNKILNLIDYAGGSMNSLGNYDVVNIFGGSTVPADFDISADASGKLLRVHDYTGLLGLDLSGFDKVQLTGNGAYMTFLGEVPAGTALIVDDGCTMLIRASKNPGATLADWPITKLGAGTGKVLLDEAAYTGLELVLDVSFDDATAGDASGKENHGVVTGTIQGVEGFDGGTAVYLRNRPGAGNYQYITFENLNGIDISKDDFTISFWYHTICGGNNEWRGGATTTTTGTGIDLNSYGEGVVYSNQDAALDASGITAVQYHQNKFFTTGITGADGTHYDKDGIRAVSDDAWHMVTVTYDREGFYKVYADGELAATVDISGQAGQQLGVNSLVLGADINGQFGMRNAYIDNVKLYSGVMNPVDVQANYIFDNANKLINDVLISESQLGSEYDPYREALLADVAKAIADMDGLTPESYVTAAGVYSALKAEYEAFMAAPEAQLTAVMLSDIHITTEGDTDSQRLETVFKDLAEQGIDPDVFINAGDFTDNSAASTMQSAFNVANALLEKYLPNTIMIAAHGNHEVAWDSATENYKASIPLYYQNIMEHLQGWVDAGKATIDSENYDETLVQVSYGYTDPEGNVVTHNAHQGYSYGVTVNGEDGKPSYHFLVLNTDYVEQTGCSKNVLNPDGSYSSAGNYLDPFRHGCKFLDGTLEWLDGQMASYAADGLPIFVINHFPFIDTAPLSYYDETVINDNSIGMFDAQVRSILASYDNVFTFSGHLHHNLGIATILDVVDETTGNSFTQVNMSAIKGATRAYGNVPSGWLMYVYEDEVVFRARDYSIGEWLPWYDVVVPLTSSEPAHVHELTKVDAMAPTSTKDGCIEHYICAGCGKIYADAEATIELAAEDVIIPATGSEKPTDGSPETGESARAVLWISLASVSMLAVICLILQRRKNRA